MTTRPALGVLVAVLGTGCSVGPNYVRPSAPTAPTYKEADGWKTAQPQDEAARGAWWEMYGDDALSTLEAQVEVSNQSLAAADARFREARAVVVSTKAAWYPTVTLGVSASRSRPPATSTTGGTRSLGTVSDYAMPLTVSWEIDVWGRIRRAVEASRATAQASGADLASTRLSLQAELATDYFQMRAVEAQRRLLDETVVDFEKSLQLTRNRWAGGVASRADVVQAETQLETARAQAIDLGVDRARLEHAIAVLVGTPASTFSLPVAPLAAVPPAIPAGMPSELLERRPDVGGAERRVAAANAEIGVATAAYYPTVTLSASGGFSNSDISKWFLWPSRFWSVGPSVSETVYDGGLRRGQTAQARAAYDEGVASYRQSVLAAFQEVEDNLATLRILEDEARVVAGAVDAAEESVRLTNDRYKAGTVSYLDVVVAQTAALANERAAVDVAGRRMSASVLLIEALGGGWRADVTGSGDNPPPMLAARP
jgi:NodT family efflux transporter outer membrane factor (OMF) lipoprotein